MSRCVHVLRLSNWAYLHVQVALDVCSRGIFLVWMWRGYALELLTHLRRGDRRVPTWATLVGIRWQLVIHFSPTNPKKGVGSMELT